MANEIQAAPNTTPTTDADWAAELNLRELSMKGYDGISLTEWAAGDTDKPQIAAGSVIEIDGAIAKFTNQTALTDEGGLADGWCYIKFVVSGSDVVPTLTNTFGTWDTAKQGFYDGWNRYSLHAMYRSGAVTKIFTFKGFVNMQNGILIQTPIQTDINAASHVDYTSSYNAGEKIKYKIIDYSTLSGSTTNLVNHGIANAEDLERIIDVRFLLRRNASTMDIFEGYSPVGLSIHTYYYTNTQITLALESAAAANSAGKLIITYI